MFKTVTKEEFKQTHGVSFSRLSALAVSPRTYLRGLEEDKSSSSLSLGSLVDTLITEPEELTKRFYVMTTNKPKSEMMDKFVNVYLESNDILLAYEKSGYKVKIEAVTKKFEEEGRAYYDAIKSAGDRKIIDFDMMSQANQMITTLKSNPFTKTYYESTDTVEILYQVPLIWKFNGAELPDIYKSIEFTAKSLLDIVRIDHKAKTIQPIDQKTGAEGFMKSYFKYKLYLQGSMYYDALRSLLPEESEYYVLPTKFIYADSDNNHLPLIYTMSPTDLYVGTNGYRPLIHVNNLVKTHGSSCGDIYDVKVADEYKYKGYRRLASELSWHERNNKWDYSYDIYQSNGEVVIDSFNVKL